MPDNRPDPDALLASLNREQQRAQRGKLKVFFGMCPGVGKTYAMLRAAQQELRDGVDLVVGVVETHGRAETEALLAGLPVIPRKADHLQEHPDHRDGPRGDPRAQAASSCSWTSSPTPTPRARAIRSGTRTWWSCSTPGIDVVTTLNVQHIESRADAVRQITGATVHETVPDSVFGLADQIELVDITPEALRERLERGQGLHGRAAPPPRRRISSRTRT